MPGAGHFLLRKWGRGALLAASILGMFALGIAMQGKLYASAHDMLEMLGWPATWATACSTSSAGLGLGADQVQVTTADYGTLFIVVSGLLNVIAAVDAHNLRTGRKLDASSLPLRGGGSLCALRVGRFRHHPARNPSRMLHFGIYCFVLFVGSAIVLSWVMFLIAR